MALASSFTRWQMRRTSGARWTSSPNTPKTKNPWIAAGTNNIPRTDSGMSHDFVGFRTALYHSIGTQAENNRPSYSDRLLKILGFYKLQRVIWKKVSEGLPQNRAEERSLARQCGRRRRGLGKRWRRCNRRGARRREKEEERDAAPRADTLLVGLRAVRCLTLGAQSIPLSPPTR